VDLEPAFELRWPRSQDVIAGDMTAKASGFQGADTLDQVIVRTRREIGVATSWWSVRAGAQEQAAQQKNSQVH
jgi:hypothetical protein